MFAKGPMPGATPKADAQAMIPELKCRYEPELGRYVVTDAGKFFCEGMTAKQAWEEAELMASAMVTAP